MHQVVELPSSLKATCSILNSATRAELVPFFTCTCGQPCFADALWPGYFAGCRLNGSCVEDSVIKKPGMCHACRMRTNLSYRPEARSILTWIQRPHGVPPGDFHLGKSHNKVLFQQFHQSTCICVRVCVCIYIYVHIYIYIYRCIHIHMYMYIYLHLHLHINIHLHLHLLVHTQKHIHARYEDAAAHFNGSGRSGDRNGTYTYTHIHAQSHIHIHRNVHIHLHLHLHIHTHMRVLPQDNTSPHDLYLNMSGFSPADSSHKIPQRLSAGTRYNSIVLPREMTTPPCWPTTEDVRPLCCCSAAYVHVQQGPMSKPSCGDV